MLKREAHRTKEARRWEKIEVNTPSKSQLSDLGQGIHSGLHMRYEGGESGQWFSSLVAGWNQRGTFKIYQCSGLTPQWHWANWHGGCRQGYYLKALGFSNVQPKLRTTSQNDPWGFFQLVASVFQVDSPLSFSFHHSGFWILSSIFICNLHIMSAALPYFPTSSFTKNELYAGIPLGHIEALATENRLLLYT